MKKQFIFSLMIAGLFTTTANAQKDQNNGGQINSTIDAFRPTCYNGNDGYIQLNLHPAGAPYQIQWSNGATTDLISGLSAGTYNLVLINAFGDTLTDAITLPNPDPIIITSAVDNPSSSTATDGSIDVAIQNTAGNYTFSWSTANGAGIDPYSEDQAQLKAGTYDLYVQDDLGCVMTKSVSLVATPDPVSGPVSGVSTTWMPNGFQGSVFSAINPGTISLRTGLNSTNFEIFDLSGNHITTHNIEVGNANIQELSLEKGTYIAIFQYKDNTLSKQIFTVH